MPDHVHLFAAPGDIDLSLENWVRYWKSQFTKRSPRLKHTWQTDHWDRRLRRSESYDQKWEYVRSNPVRHGLVARAEDWPYQGEVHVLPWIG
jgi:putative transposase